MSEYTGYICDGCGKRKAEMEVIGLHVPVAYHTRAIAEDDSGPVYAHCHVCIECAAKIVETVIPKEDKAGKLWAEKFLPKRPKIDGYE